MNHYREIKDNELGSCPNCGSSNYQRGDLEPFDDVIVTDCECSDCRSEFNESFVLKYQDLKKVEEKAPLVELKVEEAPIEESVEFNIPKFGKSTWALNNYGVIFGLFLIGLMMVMAVVGENDQPTYVFDNKTYKYYQQPPIESKDSSCVNERTCTSIKIKKIVEDSYGNNQ